MIASRSPDVSLYELAVNSEQTPQPLQLSPTTFKSIVRILLDLLIDQQIPATLWLKLPKGEVWQSEIERFRGMATAPYVLHSLNLSQELAAVPAPSLADLGDSTEGFFAEMDSSERTVVEFPTDDRSVDNQAVDDREMARSQSHLLPLAPDSQLRREYFLLIASPEFSGLVLTHRPRSSRFKLEAELPAALKPEDGSEQKHPLLGIYTFEEPILQRVLEGINQAIVAGQPASQSSAAIEPWLLTWDRLKQQGNAATLNPTLLSSLLTKQVQQQEELWRSSAVQRRQAELAIGLRQENEQLLAALRTKDEFVKLLGQELRTPLSTMKTALSLLGSSQLKPPQRQRYMDMLSQECDRQSSLISSVLDLVQIEESPEPSEMEALRLSDIVPGVVSTYQPLATEKGVMLAYTVPEELALVSCLTPWLKQIVINLLHNSIKFTPQNGQVWVRARQQGSLVQLEFRDTGVGIPTSDLPKIFDRFYRVRGSVEDPSGAGLGLSIVQELLKRCGGSIAVKSKLGEGSAFTVTLPTHSANPS